MIVVSLVKIKELKVLNLSSGVYFYTEIKLLLKAFAAISLTLLILLLPLRNTLLFVEYQLNKEFITAVYCVNKARPELKCNGQCHLAKELKAIEKQESKLLKLLNENSTIVYCWPEAATTFLTFTPGISVTGQSLYQPGAYCPPHFSIFHPPRS